MNTDGKLRDKLCGNADDSARFICERPLGAPPLCGDGWEHNGQSCYKVTIVFDIFFAIVTLKSVQKYHDEEKTEWAAARAKCVEQEADLVIVDNPNENLFIYDFAKENSIDVWLGILENVSKIKI